MHQAAKEIITPGAEGRWVIGGTRTSECEKLKKKKIKQTFTELGLQKLMSMINSLTPGPYFICKFYRKLRNQLSLEKTRITLNLITSFLIIKLKNIKIPKKYARKQRIEHKISQNFQKGAPVQSPISCPVTTMQPTTAPLFFCGFFTQNSLLISGEH